MKWFISKLVFRIVSGDGNHIGQFDEQLRLIKAGDEEEACDKAILIGRSEQFDFHNQKQQLVQWQFVGITELHQLAALEDGSELYSRIREEDDVSSYLSFVRKKSGSFMKKQGIYY